MRKEINVNIHQKSLLDFISSQQEFLTRNRIKILLKNGEIKVNGTRIKTDIALRQGDIVSIFIPENFMSVQPVKTVYEDDNIAVFFKPVLVSFDRIAQIINRPDLIAAHRLDMNTQGLIIFSKNEKINDLLIQAFSLHKIIKKYHVLVKGMPKILTQTLKAHIIKDSKTSTVKVLSKPEKGSVEIITKYNFLENYEDISLLEAEPVTGRTHQIRAHLAFIGLPVLGDNKYGDTTFNKKHKKAFQQLCAVSLEFKDMPPPLSYLNNKIIKAKDFSFI